MDQFEADLRVLEEGLRLLSLQLREVRDMAGQMTQDLYVGTREWSAADDIGNCQFSGTARGCSTMGLPLATVTVRDFVTSALLATVTADASGAFSGSFDIAPGADPENTITRTFAAGTYAARFTSPAGTKVQSLNLGANSLGTIGAGPAATYHCTSMCYYPLPNVLHATDAVDGAITLTWDGVAWAGAAGGNTYKISTLGFLNFNGSVTAGSWSCDPWSWSGSHGGTNVTAVE